MVFIPAGTLNYWQGWVYFGTFIFASALYTIYLVKYDPALHDAGRQARRAKKNLRKIIVLFIFAAFVTLIALPAQPSLRLVARTMVRFGQCDARRASSFSSRVEGQYHGRQRRVEKGQRVVDTGVYGLVRHPMSRALSYRRHAARARLVVDALTPVFLCCSISGSPARKKCSCDLVGYAEYQRKVRYRLTRSFGKHVANTPDGGPANCGIMRLSDCDMKERRSAKSRRARANREW
jgi:hypothetical protein